MFETWIKHDETWVKHVSVKLIKLSNRAIEIVFIQFHILGCWAS